MNNETKMLIKGIPIASTCAKAINRHIAIPAKRAMKRPRLRSDNAALLERLSTLDQHPARRIWHFGAPVHMNLGDQAQLLCIRAWLRDNYPDCDTVEITSNEFNGGARRATEAVRSIIGPDDIVVMQGGHTMNAIHPDASFHRAAALAFPDNRIVYFPTSMPLPDKSGQRNLVSEVGAHARTLLLARDGLSCEFARKCYPSISVHLFPDIATTLIGTMEPRRPREGVLLCLRNDGEKFYQQREIDALVGKLASWGSVYMADTSLDMTGRSAESVDVQRELDQMLLDFSRYRAVVTDRFHGVIFSRIAETPTIVLKTTDHKVLEGSRWFTDGGDAGTVIADAVESVPALVDEMAGRFPYGIAAPRFAEPYFEGLKQLIEDL